MLVLSRKVGERIVIGAGITVTVLQSERGKIRLGIEAPAHVPVRRQELITPPHSHARAAALRTL